MTSRPAILHVSRALKMHGMFHAEDLPEDEYDCCAEIAIEAYNEYMESYNRALAVKGRKKKDLHLVSDLLN